jgi:hypothetical protein
MTHSVEMLLDAHTDAVIRSVWQDLDDAGLPSQVRVKSPTNRPHVTLVAAQRIAPDVDEPLRALCHRFPLAVAVGAPLVFGGPKFTLARLIVPSAGLLDLHAEIHRLTLAHMTPDPFPHCRPGHWTPHVTLGRRFTDDQIGAALEVVTRSAGDLAGTVVGLRRWDGDERVDHPLVG